MKRLVGVPVFEAAFLAKHGIFGRLNPDAKSWPTPPDKKQSEHNGRNCDHNQVHHCPDFSCGVPYRERTNATRACRSPALSWLCHGGIAVPGTPFSKTSQARFCVGFFKWKFVGAGARDPAAGPLPAPVSP